MGREPVSKSTTLGLEPVSIVHYNRPGSSIKQPTQNLLASKCHVIGLTFTLKVATKSWTQYLRCNTDYASIRDENKVLAKMPLRMPHIYHVLTAQILWLSDQSLP